MAQNIVSLVHAAHEFNNQPVLHRLRTLVEQDYPGTLYRSCCVTCKMILCVIRKGFERIRAKTNTVGGEYGARENMTSV